MKEGLQRHVLAVIRQASSAVLVMTALLLPTQAPAGTALDALEEDSGPRFQLHGFGTLGLARSNDGNAQFVRDLSQPNGLQDTWSTKIDSQIGLQANIGFSEQTEAVFQAVSRYRHDGSFTPDITWAFLKHDLTPDFTFRGGRLGTEFFMLADTRMVGYSNLTVRPPSDYYGSLIFSYLDGIDASLTTPAAGGLLRGKLFAGISPEKSPFVEPLSWDLKGSRLVGGHVDFVRGAWQIRVGHAGIRFKNELPVDTLVGFPYLALIPEMAVADTWSSFTSLGVVYDKGPLQLQWMLNRIDHDSEANEDSKAGYFIAAYRTGALTPYLGVSRVLSRAKTLAPFDFGAVDATTALLRSQLHSDQHTIFVGARWDIRDSLALKAQIDWIDGTPSSAFPYRNAVAGWDGDMAVYSLSLDFVF